MICQLYRREIALSGLEGRHWLENEIHIRSKELEAFISAPPFIQSNNCGTMVHTQGSVFL
jgi:hypothetical protein